MSRATSDEAYLLDICDAVLGHRSRRQHRFDFLLGDPGKGGRRARLPVDAYYEELALVVEVLECQHFRPVRLFDRRMTVSGVDRREQRRRYDARRREVLPKHGITVVFLPVADFPTRGRKLRRIAEEDERILRTLLPAPRRAPSRNETSKRLSSS